MPDNPAILYVEDDPKSRMVMKMLLVEYLKLEKVIIFEDSTDFEANLDKMPFRPDIIFLDIHMNPLDGFEMLAILRSKSPFEHLPIVALTASVMNQEIQKLREAGFNGVIPKPINILEFPQTLQQLLNGEEIWRVISR